MYIGRVRFEVRASAKSSSERARGGRWAARKGEPFDGHDGVPDTADVTLFLTAAPSPARTSRSTAGKVDDPSAATKP